MSATAEMSAAIWACEARALEAYLRAIAEARARPLAASLRVEANPRPLEVRGDTAIIPVRGVLVRGRSDPWASFFGEANTGHDEIREQLAVAVATASVHRIVLAIDSPGGDAIGLSSLWEELRTAGREKPLLASISGQGASAAYYLASAADEILSEPDAMVGSIGAFAVVLDASEMAGKLGVKVHVVRSGAHKGMGVLGAPVSDEQLSGAQQVIDDLADGFVTAVAAGRGISRAQAQELATGEVWVAARAEGMGLIDRIGTLADAIAGEAGKTEVNVKGDKMRPRADDGKKDGKGAKAEDDENDEDEDEGEEDESKAEDDEDEGGDDEEGEEESGKAATLAQLERRFASRPEFIVRALKGGYSLARARREHLEIELAESKAALAKAKAQARAGIDPRALSTVHGEEDALGAESDSEFQRVARAYRDRRGGTLRDAMKAIARTKPRLYESYVHELRVSGGARVVRSWGSTVPARAPASA